MLITCSVSAIYKNINWNILINGLGQKTKVPIISTLAYWNYFPKKKKKFCTPFLRRYPENDNFFFEGTPNQRVRSACWTGFFFARSREFFFSFLKFFKNYAFVLLHFPEIPTWVKKNIQFACTCKKRFLHLQKLNIKHHVYTFK